MSTKKQKIKSNLGDVFEKEIEIIVDRVLEERKDNFTREEVKSIVQEILPELHTLTSSIVKQHIREIGKFMAENF